MPFTPTTYRPYDFANRRHIGPSPEEMDEMFAPIETALDATHEWARAEGYLG